MHKSSADRYRLRGLVEIYSIFQQLRSQAETIVVRQRCPNKLTGAVPSNWRRHARHAMSWQGSSTCEPIASHAFRKLLRRHSLWSCGRIPYQRNAAIMLLLLEGNCEHEDKRKYNMVSHTSCISCSLQIFLFRSKRYSIHSGLAQLCNKHHLQTSCLRKQRPRAQCRLVSLTLFSQIVYCEIRVCWPLQLHLEACCLGDWSCPTRSIRLVLICTVRSEPACGWYTAARTASPAWRIVDLVRAVLSHLQSMVDAASA